MLRHKSNVLYHLSSNKNIKSIGTIENSLVHQIPYIVKLFCVLQPQMTTLQVRNTIIL